MKFTIDADDEFIDALAERIAARLPAYTAGDTLSEVKVEEEEDDDLLGGDEKEKEPAVTLDQVQDAIRAACAPGKKTTKEQAKEGAKAVLKKFGAEKGTDLAADKYAAALKALNDYTAKKK